MSKNAYDGDTTVRTAPHNEVQAQYADDNGQRDDAEATAPEEAQQRNQIAIDAPDAANFFWGRNYNGDAQLKPLNSAINDLKSEFENYFFHPNRHEAMKVDNELVRRFDKAVKGLKRSEEFSTVSRAAQRILNNEPNDVERQLNGVSTRLEKIEVSWVASGFIKQIGTWAMQQSATQVYWLAYHREQKIIREEDGNENGANASLEAYESALSQMNTYFRVLDWAVENGFDIDVNKAAYSALNLRGWSITQRTREQQALERTRKTSRMDRPADDAYGSATGTSKKASPEEVAESDELDDDLDEALG